MKTKIYIICVFAFILVSCGQTEQPTTFPEEIDALFKDYITYLSGNYKEGDILLFETESGDIEEMRVESCFSGGKIITVTEKDEDDEERRVRAITTDYVQDIRATYVYLVERRTECTGLGVAIQLFPSGRQINHVDVMANREAATPHRTPAPSPVDNTIVLQTDAGWCLLERGVGIVQIADTLGHTWKLLQQE
ncbi:MAG: hypothetical protein J5823_04225 [Paludibacteraceae bacterium]|nr:hypothetical protein [Paludibacteraceae bacterium]